MKNFGWRGMLPKRTTRPGVCFGGLFESDVEESWFSRCGCCEVEVAAGCVVEADCGAESSTPDSGSGFVSRSTSCLTSVLRGEDFAGEYSFLCPPEEVRSANSFYG